MGEFDGTQHTQVAMHPRVVIWCSARSRTTEARIQCDAAPTDPIFKVSESNGLSLSRKTSSSCRSAWHPPAAAAPPTLPFPSSFSSPSTPLPPPRVQALQALPPRLALVFRVQGLWLVLLLPLRRLLTVACRNLHEPLVPHFNANANANPSPLFLSRFHSLSLRLSYANTLNTFCEAFDLTKKGCGLGVYN